MKTQTSLLKYGIFSGFILILYFLTLYWLGFAEKIELRFFNFVILATAVVLGIKKAKEKEDDFDYLRGFGVGFIITVVSTVLFAIFIFAFLELNEVFMLYLKNNAPFGSFLSPWASGAVVLFEGLSSGVIITYSAMQYFKKSGPIKVI